MSFLNKISRITHSILFQILFFMILAAVIPLVVSHMIYTSDSENLLRDNLHTLNFTQTENTAQWIINYNTAIKNELQALCDVQTNNSLSETQKETMSNILVEQDNNIDIVWIRTPQSQIFNRTDRNPSRKLEEFVMDQDAYRSILAGNVIISDPFVIDNKDDSKKSLANTDGFVMKVIDRSVFTSQTIILYGVPIWDKGQPVGALYSEVNLTPLRHHIASLTQLRTGAEIFIVDKKGHVIAHQVEKHAAGMEDFSNHEVVKKIFEAQKIYRTDKQAVFRSSKVVDPQGREMLANIKLIDEINWGRDAGEFSYLGWGVVAQEPKEFAFAPIREMSEKMANYGAIAIALAVALAGLLTFGLSRPIMLLTHGAERIAAGNYNVSVDIKSRNEIGLLAQTFNTMSAKILAYTDELKQRAQDIRDLFFSSMETIVAAIDARDPYTRGHSLRVTALSVEIGKELGLDEENIERLRIAGMLHDVGKIGIRDNVLLKKGKLTDDEFRVMKTHPVLGATIMERIKLMDLIIPGMKYHHEWWDGSGYPEGLKGENIPLYARIIAIADTFDAMTSDRPYQQKMDPDFVAGKIQGWATSRYDPSIVDAFTRVYEKGAIPSSEDFTDSLLKIEPPALEDDHVVQEGKVV